MYKRERGGEGEEVLLYRPLAPLSTLLFTFLSTFAFTVLFTLHLTSKFTPHFTLMSLYRSYLCIHFLLHLYATATTH